MIFVTGGTGLVGSHLLFNLTKLEEPVRAIYRNESRLKLVQKVFEYYNPQNADLQWNRIEWIKGDILNIPDLEIQIDGCNKVYHCAGFVSHRKQDFNKLIKINREGTANMVNIALSAGVEKFCHVSSTAAIGGSNDKLIDEEVPWKNTPTTSGYSISKYSAEKEVWRAMEEGLNAVIVNPCVIIGAGNWNDSSLTMFKTLEKGTTYYPPGANAIVDARDLTEIMIRLMESDISHERFLCIGSNQSFKELVTKISQKLQVKPPKKEAKRYEVFLARKILDLKAFITRQPNSLTKETVDNLFAVRAYDNSKICDALNFRFRDFDDALNNAVKGRIR